MTSLRSVVVACSFATVVHAQATELPRPPGTLVDVGGKRLHLLCSGQGSPTVILEAGASVGFVFVDPSTEDRLFTMLNGEGVLIASLTPEQLRSTLPRQAVPVPRRAPQTGTPFDKLPPELYEIRLELDKRLIASTPSTVTPEFIGTFQENERALLARLLASRTTPPQPALGSRPTVVLTRGDERNAGREEVHAALAKLSTNSRHSVIAGAGHEIHLFAPSAVIEAISDVVQSIRSKAALPAR